jgi:hypothetical protein
MITKCRASMLDKGKKERRKEGKRERERERVYMHRYSSLLPTTKYKIQRRASQSLL